MKDTKFRVQDKKYKCFCDDFAITNDCRLIDFSDAENSYFADNKDYKILQYTGFKDCKGVEIFEGDIVKYTTCDFFSKAQTKREFYGLVYFSRGAFRVKTKKLEFGGENSDLLENRCICEVVGNIYGNKGVIR